MINCVFQELFAAMYEKCFAWCIGSNGTRSWQYDKFGWHYSRLNWFYLVEFLWNEQIMGANATPGTFKVHLILIFIYPKDILWIFGEAFERNMAIITRIYELRVLYLKMVEKNCTTLCIESFLFLSFPAFIISISLI